MCSDLCTSCDNIFICKTMCGPYISKDESCPMWKPAGEMKAVWDFNLQKIKELDDRCAKYMPQKV